MQEKFKQLLDTLCQNPNFYDTTILIGKLRVINVLNDDIVHKLKKQESLDDKRKELFETLKREQDSFIDQLETIFRSNRWYDGTMLIEETKNSQTVPTVHGAHGAQLKPYVSVFKTSLKLTDEDRRLAGLRNVFNEHRQFDVRKVIYDPSMLIDDSDILRICGRGNESLNEMQRTFTSIMADKGLPAIERFYQVCLREQYEIAGTIRKEFF